jgi:hypothetical protein
MSWSRIRNERRDAVNIQGKPLTKYYRRVRSYLFLRTHSLLQNRRSGCIEHSHKVRRAQDGRSISRLQLKKPPFELWERVVAVEV